MACMVDVDLTDGQYIQVEAFAERFAEVRGTVGYDQVALEALQGDDFRCSSQRISVL